MSLKDKKEPTVQTKASDIKTTVVNEIQLKRNESKSKEHPSRTTVTTVPTDQCISRWNKLKALREQNESNFENLSKLSPEERTVWKSSKLFSKNLSSIDGIRSSKKANSSQMSASTREHSSTELLQKSMNTNPCAASPKRLTSQLCLSGPAAVNTKQSEWKLLKSKLSSLRKKGTKDISGNCIETSIIAKDIKEVNSGAGVSKQEKSAQLTSISSPIESILTKKSVSSEEKGIICKKEDLMHIISEASKGIKVTKTKSLNSEDDDRNGLSASTSTASASTTANTPTADVSTKKNSLKKQNSCGSESSCEREDNNKTKQSNTRNECLDSCQTETAHKNQYKSSTNKTVSSTVAVEECVEQHSENDNLIEQNESEIIVKNKTTKSSISSKRKPINETNSADSQTHSQTDNESESNVPAVQWDDINFVDPSLIGDAIQTFLQGLAGTGASGSSSSTTVTNTNEKRVSFKKSF